MPVSGQFIHFQFHSLTNGTYGKLRYVSAVIPNSGRTTKILTNRKKRTTDIRNRVDDTCATVREATMVRCVGCEVRQGLDVTRNEEWRNGGGSNWEMH